ncbi:helix-turn-helix domain-containing protein [Streptomyces sp. C10]|uniref:helix-turn-helix domain-containing protein n=1 Tax=Streptomyces sp. C10 TaxID=531941 RepID=UPI00397FDF16
MLNAIPDAAASARRTISSTPANNSGRAARRTADVMRALADLQQTGSGRAVYLREIAAAAGLDRGTAHRYLQALIDTGMVYQPYPGKGAYVLNWRAPEAPAQAHPSQWMATRLARLQDQTGQIALLFVPYLVSQHPLRLRTETAWGTHKPVTHEDLDIAPLDADAPGLVMRAAMRGRPRTRLQGTLLREIRETGYASSPALLATHDIVAAPVMREKNVAGAVAVMAVRHLMQSSRRRADFIKAILETAGAMSCHLTSQTSTRAAA